MTEGTIKTSKYEIIAIFREELRKRTEIEIFFNNTSIITQLTRVDFAEFHIQTHRKIPSGHKIRFLLHSDSGKIEFNAALTKHDNSGVDKGIRYAFSLPECLQVVQRRRDPRFRLRYAMSMTFIAAAAIKTAKTIFSISKTFQMAVAH